MSEFAKTLIVDASLQDPEPPYYNNIKKAADALSDSGGTVIVESGTYIFNEEDENHWNTTVRIPSNVTLIGRGNAVISLRRHDISAFRNAGPYLETPTGNENITITGFKIVVSPTVEYGTGGSAGVIKLVNVKKCKVEKVYITCNPESSYGISPGNLENQDEPYVFPASAIRVESDKDNDHGGSDNCTDNIITRCTIEEFGKNVPMEGKYYPETNRYGIGIFLKRGNRNKIICNYVKRAKMCCVVGPGMHYFFPSVRAA